MGLQPSKQPSIGEVRLQALEEEERRALDLQRALREAFAAEPADRMNTPGSALAQLTAVVNYIKQLRSERWAVIKHLGGRCQRSCVLLRHWAGCASSEQPGCLTD